MSACRVILWMASWASLGLCMWRGSAGPYLLVTCLETHSRIPAPLGQFIPVLDVTTNFFHVHAWWLWIGFLALFVIKIFWNDDHLYVESALYWLGCSVVLAYRAYKSWGVCKVVRDQYCFISGFPSEWFQGSDARLFRLPFYGRIHPFLFWFSPRNITGLQGSVDIYDVTVTSSEETEVGILDGSPKLLPVAPAEEFSSAMQSLGPLHIDVWTNSAQREFEFLLSKQDGEQRKPVLLFLHGGGWLGGYKRLHSSVCLLHNLAARGWLVVSVGYRKVWPLHIDDAVLAYNWILKEGAKWGADINRIYLCGGSAGGHLASLLSLRVLRNALESKKLTKTMACNSSKTGVCGIVLFYPAIDVQDEAHATAFFPFSCSCLGIEYKQSLLSWFFEKLVMRLPEGTENCDKWEQANPLLQLRQYYDTLDDRTCFPPVLSVHGELDSIVPIEHSSHWLKEIKRLSTQRIPSTSHLLIEEKLNQDIEPFRSCDALITIPGAKHSFEIAASSVVDVTIQGVLGWLSLQEMNNSQSAGN